VTLARILIEGLDPAQDRDVEQVWVAEAQRRYQAYLRGEIEAHDGYEVMTRARNRLKWFLMIPYRFLTPAEEEMTEAALFYEAASSQLGSDFLDDVQRQSIGCGNFLKREKLSLRVSDKHCRTVFLTVWSTP
jgi:hypothetical protein